MKFVYNIPIENGKGIPDPVVPIKDNFLIEYSKLKGKLIVFEGLDGSGKTTQIENLKKYLTKKGLSVVSHSFNNSDIVNISLMRAKWLNCGPLIINLLSIAAFYDVLNTFIIPSLVKGKIVISDRYYYSIIARGLAQGLRGDIYNKVFCYAPKPDIVIFLDLTAKKCLLRKLSTKGKKISYWESGMFLRLTKCKEKSFIIYQNRIRKRVFKIK